MLLRPRVAQVISKSAYCMISGVWWFPPLVLQMAAFALSATWGVLIFGISFYAWHSQEHAQAVRPHFFWLCLYRSWQ